MVSKVDNTQAIAAVEKGYSKKLRHLQRTHRVSLGYLNEAYTSEDGLMVLQHHPTATHKADALTKAMTPAKFISSRELMGLVLGGNASTQCAAESPAHRTSTTYCCTRSLASASATSSGSPSVFASTSCAAWTCTPGQA